MTKDFSHQDLTGRSFAGQDLRGTNFRHANLTRANLAGADLTGANLLAADLTDAITDGAVGLPEIADQEHPLPELPPPTSEQLARNAEERRKAKEAMLDRNAARMADLKAKGLIKDGETLEDYDTRMAKESK